MLLAGGPVFDMTALGGIDRRRFALAAGAAAGGLIAVSKTLPEYFWAEDQRPLCSRVAVVSADSYFGDLEDLLVRGLRLFNIDLKGKTVLLKPNLVEYIPGVAVNTDPLLIGAAVDAFLRLGAGRVVVAEGPGHQRDTYLLLVGSGLDDQLQPRRIGFVDLNRDELVKTRVRADYTGLEQLWLPKTVLSADLIVSIPKVKTHHWAGVTLSMKNMFGVIPGVKYGWPKNVLHWLGIERSILDICATVRPHFVIADGIIAMEGNGPLHGRPRELKEVVLADDPVAADFTCTRLMGLRPEWFYHLDQASRFLGNGDVRKIEQLAEAIPLSPSPFAFK